MSIVIKEVCGNNGVLGVSLVEQHNLQESAYDQASDPIASDSIMVDIEGIHEVVTRNFNRYTKESLRKSIPTWTKPYHKPMIMHHNEKDGKIIGRIKHVELKEHNTRSGTPALLFSSNISDREGKEQVKDGRLSTVSIGVIAHDVRCSICGHNIAMYGECDEHEKGQVYEGERCYWDIHEFEGKELSYVIVPSDVYAGNVRIYEPTGQKALVAEQLSTSEVLDVKGKENLQESADVQEEKILDEEIVDNKEEKAEAAEQEPAKEETSSEVSKAETEETAEETKDEKQASADKLEEIISELEQVKQELSEAKNELSEEKSLREALEGELEGHRMALKETLATEILSLRESAGRKPIEKEVLLSRSEESLKDAIADLKEELEGAEESDMNITESATKKIESPGLSSENEPGHVKEEKSDSNIVEEAMDLQESFNSLFD